MQTCERGEGGFGVCSSRPALGSYFHMHCLPSLRSPGLQVSTASSPVFPGANFGYTCPHLIFDNVPNPTAALSRDLRSANTNPRHISSSCSQILTFVALQFKMSGSFCAGKTATELLPQLPPTVTRAPGWPTVDTPSSLMACQYSLTTCLLDEL